MKTKEECMEIRILSRQGKGIREISRITGISRNTVRKYLRKDKEEPGYEQRPKRASKLDPFKSYLLGRVKAASPHRLPAPVLHREIIALGYTGSERLLRSYLSSQRPKKEAEPVVRIETPPGQQMQADWIELRRGSDPLSAFVATLGYSRATFVKFVNSERFEVLRECHEEAFAYFGGVPREVLYDNMKTVVLERNTYGEGKHRFHAGLWHMARDFGFMPRLCRPYRAKTKGKVERFNRYLKYSFYVPLQSRLVQAGLSLDAATANAEVRKWLVEVANCRIHGETGKRPVELPKQQNVAVQHEEALPLESWPVVPLQRPPLVYEYFFQEVD